MGTVGYMIVSNQITIHFDTYIENAPKFIDIWYNRLIEGNEEIFSLNSKSSSFSLHYIIHFLS
jgi:hypothetical protein